MLPIAIPEGTSLLALLTEVIPSAHARLVPPSATGEEHRALLDVEGLGRFVARVRGAELDVREGDEARPDLALAFRADVAERFVADWTGPRRFVPTFTPADAPMLSDPRLIRRLAMATGAIEVAIQDFPVEGGAERVAMTLACGAAARRGLDHPPDVTVEATVEDFERILHGALAPEEAIADGHVLVRGKKLVAMQIALALAPFFPKRGSRS